jgi:hypothetical protein
MRRPTAGRAHCSPGALVGTRREWIVRLLSVIALAALAACASDVPGPLTGHYEGTCSSFTPGLPEDNSEPCSYRPDIRQTDQYVDGTSATTRGANATVSRAHIDGRVSGGTLTACTRAEGDNSQRCVAAWGADVMGSGAPGTVLDGRVCNNSHTTLCLKFRLVKQ